VRATLPLQLASGFLRPLFICSRPPRSTSSCGRRSRCSCSAACTEMSGCGWPWAPYGRRPPEQFNVAFLVVGLAAGLSWAVGVECCAAVALAVCALGCRPSGAQYRLKRPERLGGLVMMHALHQKTRRWGHRSVFIPRASSWWGRYGGSLDRGLRRCSVTVRETLGYAFLVMPCLHRDGRQVYYLAEVYLLSPLEECGRRETPSRNSSESVRVGWIDGYGGIGSRFPLTCQSAASALPKDWEGAINKDLSRRGLAELVGQIAGGR